MTLYTQADKNTRLTWLYITGFLVFVIGAGYVFAGAMNSSGILYGAVIFSILMSFGSYWWSDKIVLAMSGAKELNHENNREVYHLVENLCITAGLPLPKIYLIEDSAPNAFATGRDPQHGVICLTSGIIQKLEKTQSKATKSNMATTIPSVRVKKSNARCDRKDTVDSSEQRSMRSSTRQVLHPDGSIETITETTYTYMDGRTESMSESSIRPPASGSSTTRSGQLSKRTMFVPKQ